MTERTHQEITDVETRAMTLLEVGEVDKPIIEYIEVLQDAIAAYQGELYARNSDVSSLTVQLDKAKSNIGIVKESIEQYRKDLAERKHGGVACGKAIDSIACLFE